MLFPTIVSSIQLHLLLGLHSECLVQFALYLSFTKSRDQIKIGIYVQKVLKKWQSLSHVEIFPAPSFKAGISSQTVWEKINNKEFWTKEFSSFHSIKSINSQFILIHVDPGKGNAISYFFLKVFMSVSRAIYNMITMF